MRTLDRYIFRQLIGPVFGAVAALTAIALLSQSLTQFDLVVERGQNGWTFAKVALLSLPQLAGLIFPIALFVGTLVALTRLQGEHEITAARAAGEPLMRLASPMIRIGVYFSLVALLFHLFVQPFTARAMRQELFRIKNDLISSMVKEGEFSTSESGLTIFVQSIDQNGLLKQIYIRTPALNGQDRTYVAREGRIKVVNGASILIMRNGSTQQMSDKRVLNDTTFDEFSFDVTPYFTNDDFLEYKEGDRYMHELLFPNLAYEGDKVSKTKLLAEVNSRLSGPFFNLCFMLLAIVSILGGRFSRTGYGRRIAAAAGLAAVIRIIGVAVETACQEVSVLNFLQYAVPLVPIFICLHLIRRHDALRVVTVTRSFSVLQPLT